MAGQQSCAACNQIINDRRYLTCALCSDKYDIECVNVSESRFYNTMTVEHKRKWACPQCKSKQPKQDNTNTPVRSHLLNIAEIDRLNDTTKNVSPIIDVDNTNVTQRKKTIITYAEDTSLCMDNTLPEGDTININEETSSILLRELRALRDQITAQSQKQETRDYELSETIRILQTSINNINDRYIVLETQIKSVTAEIEQNKNNIKELQKENKQLRQELLQTKEIVSTVIHKPDTNNASNSSNVKNVTLQINSQEEMRDKSIMNWGLNGKPEIQQDQVSTIEHNGKNSKILVLYGLDEIRFENEAELHDRIIDVFQSIIQVDLTGYIEEFERIGQRGTRRPLKIELLSKRMTKYLLSRVQLFRSTGLWISELLDQKGLQDRKKRRETRRKTRQYVFNNNKKILPDQNLFYQKTQHTEYMNDARKKNHSFRQQ